MISPNEAYINELYFDYLKDPNSVSQHWREYFQSNAKNLPLMDYSPVQSSITGVKTAKKFEQIQDVNQQTAAHQVKKYEIAEPFNSLQSRIAMNMEESLSVPTATSYRTIPIKVLEENRRIINNHLAKNYQRKISFTHIIAWAIIKALTRYPNLNSSIALIDNKLHRLIRKTVNFGVAIDLTKNDGSRILLVPNIKDADKLDIRQFIHEYDIIVNKARANKLDLSDLIDTTVTLTNPGMIGTAYSAPRLMQGQGCIIGIGAIDYPMEFQAVRHSELSKLAISKVVTISNTYDHRIIQGAESADFLAYIHKLLLGEENFYDQIFYSLKVPFEAFKWMNDSDEIKNKKQEFAEKTAHINQMINAYRVRGHFLASTNPLGHTAYYYPELDPSFYGFTIWDLDRVFHVEDEWENNNITLRETLELLRDSYCGQSSIEFMHIQDFNRKNWIKKYFENARGNYQLPKDEKLNLLKKIIKAETFENFLHTKFIGTKRFSLEGAETLIVMMDKFLQNSADTNLNSVVIGMAHRGRLNVLANVLNKNLFKIFREFEGDFDDNNYQGSGDVKYHLGYEGEFISEKNNKINVHLAANPSHLEMVDPIVVGIARALCNKTKDTEYKKVLPILVHGDASFAGQGVVMETLNLSELEGYKTGGTVHIVVNNQIGFTTNTDESRSTYYCTDIAKMVQAPILHVNGNDPEAIQWVSDFAFRYRQEFNSDVVIDLLCYRKYGHNEADEPTYTQPLLYKKIKQLPPISRFYANRLIDARLITPPELEKIYQSTHDFFEIELEKFKKSNLPSQIKVMTEEREIPEFFFDYSYVPKTTEETLKHIADAITKIPSKFNINPKVKTLLEKRNKMVFGDQPSIDWGMGEHLAFGSILIENRDVRITGQDTRRGTFSHRHGVLIDYRHEDHYIPLNNLSEKQGRFRIFDSPLSEYAVLGFEYGYSLIEKEGLTIWEAQFGDFANNAIPIVDQYLSCGETKWGQYSNLTLFLPHSHDGQGPEHSSARPERYLQLCSEGNMIIANITTPANFYHLLRRQVYLPKRVPLIVLTPKGLLRHPMVVSKLDDFTNSDFQTIIDINNPKTEYVEKVVFLTGKIYFDILQEIHKQKITNIALIRVEQLYPLDRNSIKSILQKYNNANKIIWMQEEPKNQGYWNYIFMEFLEFVPEIKLNYIGRPSSPATATGSSKVHTAEQEYIIKQLINF